MRSEFMSVTIPDIGGYLLGEFGHFSDSNETVDSMVSWVVVQGGRFWYLKSRVLAGWAGRLRNVRLAALDLREDIRVDLVGS